MFLLAANLACCWFIVQDQYTPEQHGKYRNLDSMLAWPGQSGQTVVIADVFFLQSPSQPGLFILNGHITTGRTFSTLCENKLPTDIALMVYSNVQRCGCRATRAMAIPPGAHLRHAVAAQAAATPARLAGSSVEVTQADELARSTEAQTAVADRYRLCNWVLCRWPAMHARRCF